MPSLMADVGEMPPPPTPKRPTLGMKRDSSHLDDDGPPMATKKPRVAFDDRVDIRIMDNWNDKSFDLVKEEVRVGILRHIAPADRRDDTQYAKLVHLLGQTVFSGDAPSSRLLLKYIAALESRVNSLGECNTLVMAVLNLSWLGRDDAFIASYVKFLRALAGAHATYVSVIMSRLISYFERIPSSAGRLPAEEPISKAIMLDRVHGVIELLLKRIPSAGYVLMRRLRQQFPSDLSPTRAYLQYQKNLIHLSNGVPELKDEILALIMHRLVNLDVQIQRDLDELAEDEEDNLLRPGISGSANTMEDSDDSDSESDSESEITLDEVEQALQDLKLKVTKIDGTQDLLFNYYHENIHPGDEPNTSTAFRQLLSNFDNFIMPTRSRHAQFLLFHFSQQSPRYAEAFISHFQDILENDGAVTTRITACSYIASFTARGSHIPTGLVRQVFEDLCSTLEEFRRRWEPGCFGPDRRRFALYYAVVQALLYMFCFRWRDLVVHTPTPELNGDMSEDDLLAEGHDLTWLPAVKETMHRNVNSKLNPLRVCSEAIVTEFAKVSNHLRFLYVYSLLERNKRVRLGKSSLIAGSGDAMGIAHRETTWDRKEGEAHHQLEAYFPFDPYQLPKSKKWIGGDYNDWVLPPGLKQDGEDDDNSNSEDERDSDDEDAAKDLPLGDLSCVDTVSVGS